MPSPNEPGGPIGVLGVRWADVVLDLFEPLRRDDIALDCLFECRVRPLVMRGAPEFGPEDPYQLVKVADLPLSSLRKVETDALVGLPRSWSAERKEKYLNYARDRVAFVLNWAAKNPTKYGRLVIHGAYRRLGEGYTESQMWRALRAQFKEHDGEAVSEHLLTTLCNRAYLRVSKNPFGARR